VSVNDAACWRRVRPRWCCCSNQWHTSNDRIASSMTSGCTIHRHYSTQSLHITYANNRLWVTPVDTIRRRNFVHRCAHVQWCAHLSRAVTEQPSECSCRATRLYGHQIALHPSPAKASGIRLLDRRAAARQLSRLQIDARQAGRPVHGCQRQRSGASWMCTDNAVFDGTVGLSAPTAVTHRGI
jgi:hypothetical protein